jgi:hypothetical protein
MLEPARLSSSSAHTCTLLALILAGVPLPGSAQAQGEPELPPGVRLGVQAIVVQPTGEFGDYVDLGGGLRGSIRFDLDDTGVLGLRVEAGGMTYGRETRRVCLSETVGCRITVDLTTSNNVFMMGVGPEIALPVGPFDVFGSLLGGFSYYATSSSVQGTRDDTPFATSENYGDGGWAWNWGGGVRLPITRGRMPVALEIGLSHQRNGRREYLTRGDIQELPGGEIELDVKRSDADFLTWGIGVSIGRSRGG